MEKFRCYKNIYSSQVVSKFICLKFLESQYCCNTLSLIRNVIFLRNINFVNF